MCMMTWFSAISLLHWLIDWIFSFFSYDSPVVGDKLRTAGEQSLACRKNSAFISSFLLAFNGTHGWHSVCACVYVRTNSVPSFLIDIIQSLRRRVHIRTCRANDYGTVRHSFAEVFLLALKCSVLSCQTHACTLQVFAGNINTYIAELREINPPIIARKIRLIPHSDHPRTICLRLELYGCAWRGAMRSFITNTAILRINGIVGLHG